MRPLPLAEWNGEGSAEPLRAPPSQCYLHNLRCQRIGKVTGFGSSAERRAGQGFPEATYGGLTQHNIRRAGKTLKSVQRGADLIHRTVFQPNRQFCRGRNATRGLCDIGECARHESTSATSLAQSRYSRRRSR
jgi:hypothetical protein